MVPYPSNTSADGRVGEARRGRRDLKKEGEHSRLWFIHVLFVLQKWGLHLEVRVYFLKALFGTAGESRATLIHDKPAGGRFCDYGPPSSFLRLMRCGRPADARLSRSVWRVYSAYSAHKPRQHRPKHSLSEDTIIQTKFPSIDRCCQHKQKRENRAMIISIYIAIFLKRRHWDSQTDSRTGVQLCQFTSCWWSK
jgi:hypothetical protein